MSNNLDYIKNRLSLRNPQSESLDILDNVMNIILEDSSLDIKLRKIKANYDWFESFDRDFPSLCFSIATGVGKTRLMGAFVAYLYTTHNIKNFMIIAPNITIYDKLKSDFSDSGSEKYVFKGIKEFVQNPPNIITGENYSEQGKATLWKSDITINIFNIDKINKEEQSIKSLSEWLGESYYDYLCELENLVILMDESHHYRATRGMQVLNELKAILGLELTATPQVERNGRTIKFGNIIYDYPLSKALIDGYVKDPFVATKRDFNPNNYNPDELDKLKLIDGLAIHENTKIALEKYAKDNNVRLVKPFAMVICKDIEHGEKIINYIKSDEFYEGKYKDKVLFINSKNGKTEKDENIQKLLMLEHPYNPIEIVVHVNMLKEGWDVTNLYTIIPLRRSASQTLTEQTMGRGLRLPYRKRTGLAEVDGLTIVSHDKYQELVDEAHKPTSIFNVSNIVNVEDLDLAEKEVVTSTGLWETNLFAEISEEDNEDAKIELVIKKEITRVISITPRIDERKFTQSDIRNLIVSSVESKTGVSAEIIEERYDNVVTQSIDTIIQEYKNNTINIPYISVNRQTTIEQEYKDFDFDYSRITNYHPLSDSMIIQRLEDGETFEITLRNKKYNYIDPKEFLFEKIIESPTINYEECKEILNKHIDGYLKLLSEKYNDDDIFNIVFNFSSYIVKEFCNQLNEHMETTSNYVDEPIVQEHMRILNSNYTKYKVDDILNYNSTLEKSEIPKKIFTGFKKSYHNLYKFDSNTEKDFSLILEQSDSVIRWLRPATNQFNIYWNNQSKYEPDFIVESEDSVYMIEVKAENQIETDEVQLKKAAAEKYCSIVNEYGEKHNLKPWRYIIIPDSDIKTNYTFDRYI